jgi:hypothetical protein
MDKENFNQKINSSIILGTLRCVESGTEFRYQIIGRFLIKKKNPKLKKR